MEHIIWTVLTVALFISFPFVSHGIDTDRSPYASLSSLSQENNGSLPNQVNWNLTGRCAKDLNTAFYNTTQYSLYLDATGKPNAGLWSGNLAWFGHFDECQSLSHSRYFLVQIQASIVERGSPKHAPLVIQWGLCAVTSCNKSEIEQLTPQLFNETLNIPFINVQRAEVFDTSAPPVSKGYWITVWLTLICVILVVLGTCGHVWLTYRQNRDVKVVHSIDDRGPHVASQISINSDDSQQFLDQEVWDRPPDSHRLKRAFRNEPGLLTYTSMCFSVVYNLGQLTGSTPPREGHVTCLDGMRVITIWWIILAHTFLGIFSTGAVENPKMAETYSKRLSWQPIANAYFSVDTFFFLSGFLVSFLTLGHLNKHNGKFPVVKYLLHRYLRLAPLMGFSILLWTFVLPHLGSGPLWHRMASQPSCERYWWTNMLFILNFYPVSPNDQCIGWTWYLANDMQLYLFAPVIIYVLYCGTKKGTTLAVVLLLAGFAVTGALIGSYKIDVNLTGMVLNQDTQGAHDYEQIIYSKPYCRVAPYLVGILLGYILDIEKNRIRRMPKLLVLGMWVLAVGAGIALILTFYGTFHGHPLNLAENVVYGTFSHFVWGLSLAWVVYACRHHYGGLVDRFLSWRGWQPLSRMTYAVYMTHPLVIYYFTSVIKSPVYVSDINMAFWYGGTMMTSYLGAAVLMLLIELPISNVEKLIRGSFV